jgi:hypothetical protein
MTQPELEHGEEIRLSLRKAGTAGCTVLVALVIGVVGPVLGVGAYIAWRDGQFHWAVALPFGLLFFFVGICFLVYGLIVGFSVVVGVWRSDRLLLGERSLQCIARDGKVLTRVPYDNIDEIMLVEEPDEAGGPPYRMVGIKLIDPANVDTILGERSPLIGEDGYDVLIRDFYRVSPKKIYKKLLSRRKHV